MRSQKNMLRKLILSMFPFVFVIIFISVKTQYDCAENVENGILNSPSLCQYKNPFTNIPHPFFELVSEKTSEKDNGYYNVERDLEYRCEDENDIRNYLSTKYTDFGGIRHVIFLGVNGELKSSNLGHFNHTYQGTIYKLGTDEVFQDMDIFQTTNDSAVLVIVTDTTIHYLNYMVSVDSLEPIIEVCNKTSLGGKNIIDVRVLKTKNDEYYTIIIRSDDVNPLMYHVDFMTFNGECGVEITESFSWDVTISSNGKFLSFDIFTHYIELDHTNTDSLFLTSAATDKNIIFIFNDGVKVLLIPFNDTNFSIDFDDVSFEMSIFYEGEDIQDVSIFSDVIRKINYENSDCSLYLEPKNQGISIMILDHNATASSTKVIVGSLVELEITDLSGSLDMKNYAKRPFYCKNQVFVGSCVDRFVSFDILLPNDQKLTDVEISYMRPIQGRNINESSQMTHLNMEAFCTYFAKFAYDILDTESGKVLAECMNYNDTLYSCDVERLEMNPSIRKGITTNFMFWNFFLTSNDEIKVFSGNYKLNETSFFQESSYLNFDMNLAATIYSVGKIESFLVSSNGHLSLIVSSREKWELESYYRALSVCEEYYLGSYDEIIDNMEDSYDFKQNMINSCDGDWSHIPSADDFVQYVSPCGDGLHCPSLTESVIEGVSDGEYVPKPFLKNICPKGFYCQNGIINTCPAGFFCDKEGLKTPEVCVADIARSGLFSCAFEGLTENFGMSNGCPAGRICTNPVTSIPVPPGYKQEMIPNSDRVLNFLGALIGETSNSTDDFVIGKFKNEFVPCDLGNWCSLESVGRDTYEILLPGEEYPTEYVCPEGTYCPTTDVLIPTFCEYSAPTDFGFESGYSEYCEAGTYEVTLCPAGYYCHGPLSKEECGESLSGRSCVAGTFHEVICPSGYYCPTPAERIICPYMNYCPPGSVKPVSCGLNFFCFEGSEVNSYNVIQLLAIPVLLILVGVCMQCFMMCCNYCGRLRSRYNYSKFKKMDENEKRHKRKLLEKKRLEEKAGEEESEESEELDSDEKSNTDTEEDNGDGDKSEEEENDDGSSEEEEKEGVHDSEENEGGESDSSDQESRENESSGETGEENSSSEEVESSNKLSRLEVQQEIDDDSEDSSYDDDSDDEIDEKSGMNWIDFLCARVFFRCMGCANLFVSNCCRRKKSDFSKKERLKLDLAFRDLTLKLKGNGQTVLNKVTGILEHSKVTAVMGLSGCGKTSFITALAGKAYYGHTKGDVLANGSIVKLKKLKKLVAFVPQEDIMMRSATVEETLTFSARTRLPDSWSGPRKDRLVHKVIRRLGLSDILDQLIGDEEKRGISGGQRKRVNIGMELVADPVILFLDEPTSGLDAFSALEVSKTLKKLARVDGMNIITVMHQPRYEIFEQMDNLLLLCRGGKVAYLGATLGCLPYFEELGFVLPPNMNPADFFMDCVGGVRGDKKGEKWTDEMFAEQWKERRLPDIEKEFDLMKDGVFEEKIPNPAKENVASKMLALSKRFGGISGSDPESLIRNLKIPNISSIDSDSECGKEVGKEREMGSPGEALPQLFDGENKQPVDGLKGIDGMQPNRKLDDIGVTIEASPLTREEKKKEREEKKKEREEKKKEKKAFEISEYRRLRDERKSRVKERKKKRRETARKITREGHLRSVNIFTQFYHTLFRAIVIRMRELKNFYLDNFMMVIGAAMLGFLYQGLTIDMLQIFNLGAMVVNTLSLCAALGSLATFQNKVVFIRENSSGLRASVHYLALNIVDLVSIVVCPFVFLVVMFFMATPLGNFGMYFLIGTSVCFATYGYGYNISILFGEKNEKITVIITVVVMNLFGGMLKTLHDMRNQWPIPLSFVPYIVFPTYGSASYFIWEALAFEDVFDIDESIEAFGYERHWGYWGWGVVLFFGILFRISGYICLIAYPPDSKIRQPLNYVIHKLKCLGDCFNACFYGFFNCLSYPCRKKFGIKKISFNFQESRMKKDVANQFLAMLDYQERMEMEGETTEQDDIELYGESFDRW